MKVSIIIPTYNRSSQITTLLKSLESQTYKDFEVIVVNDGSSDNTLETLNNFKADSLLNITIINSPNKGRAGSRNLGSKQANGDLLIFFDDDVRPSKSCVDSHVQFHKLHGENNILGGACFYDDSKFKDDFNFFRKEMESSWYQKTNKYLKSESLRINGANFSIHRNIFEGVNGFDERLTDKEDFALAYRVHKIFKTQVYFSRDTWVYHDDFKGLKDYINRAIESRKAELEMLNLYSDLKELDPKRFITKPSFLKSFFFNFFKLKRVIDFCDSNQNFLLLPKFIRYKFYDFIITANVAYGIY
ncbi:hypothetical protein GCM10027429_07090 [Marivirga atlantica]|jgi:glycosyltransferase involved in cell wall biosynthesis|uniref:Glycosyltransferase family 2 protein n=1 Tax=Marivirga atlantica TaxID=1548457 RepID=A0A937AEV0_9BACT|nr:glycosyltransferase family 2 protein [Marivirga atlantica]MBL0764319.1 glycosyltransferase family 2 protein [Marivirga atlantica]